MIRNILAPTDFSAPASEAIRYASALAARYGASTHLLYASSSDPENLPDDLPPELAAAIRSGDRASVQAQLATYYAESCAGLALQAHIAGGPAAGEILAMSEALRTDLIVIGYAGAGQADQMGRVTQEVIARAEAPVLVVPMPCRYQPIRHMIYATNFEHLDPDDSEQVLEMASLLDARLSCLHVESQALPWTGMQESLFEVVFEAAAGEQAVQFYYTQSEDTQQGISDFVQAHAGDLLIMMRRRRPAEGLSPSLTRQMMRSAQIPLLILHEKRRGMWFPRPTDH